MKAALLLLISIATLGGCVGYVEPVGVEMYAPAPVIVAPFPYVWIGPGYYGGRYYHQHPGHGHPGRGKGRGHR